MQLLHFTYEYHSRTRGFIASFVLLLLLAWQLSYKTTTVDKNYVAVSQSAADTTELGIDPSDVDFAIPSALFEHSEFSGWLACCTILLLKPFTQIFVPQSRAPPAFL